jgi:hypothetical protein
MTAASMKNIIFSHEISIELKGHDAVTLPHYAWYIFGSNEIQALMLSGKVNRRYMVINTRGGKEGTIGIDRGDAMIKIFKEYAADFLAYILKNHGDKEHIQAIETEGKKELQRQSETFTEKFFVWFENTYPHINQIIVSDRPELIREYCISE